MWFFRLHYLLSGQTLHSHISSKIAICYVSIAVQADGLGLKIVQADPFLCNAYECQLLYEVTCEKKTTPKATTTFQPLQLVALIATALNYLTHWRLK